VKSHGVILIAVCVGNDCDTECLRQAAISARYFFGLNDPGGLYAVFDRIRKSIAGYDFVSVHQATITDLLPPGAEFLPGSEEPGAYVSVQPEGTRLIWTTPPYWGDRITVTYLARPLASRSRTWMCWRPHHHLQRRLPRRDQIEELTPCASLAHSSWPPP
jgi:hypothetical protein